MSNRLKYPSEVGHDVELDKETLLFLKKELGSDLSGILKTDDDYHRVTFYLKCIELRHKIADSDISQELKDKAKAFLESKKNMDITYQCASVDANEFENNLKRFLGLDRDLPEEFFAVQTCWETVRNDFLHTTWKDGNESVGNNAHLSFVTEYFPFFETKHPNETKIIVENHAAKVKEEMEEQKIMKVMLQNALEKAYKKAQKRAEEKETNTTLIENKFQTISLDETQKKKRQREKEYMN